MAIMHTDQTSIMFFSWTPYVPPTKEEQRMVRLGRRPKGWDRHDWFHQSRSERKEWR